MGEGVHVFLSVEMYPKSVFVGRESMLKEAWRNAASGEKCLAIGEVGLDENGEAWQCGFFF